MPERPVVGLLMRATHWRDNNFQLLWSGYLVSTIGSKLLIIVLSLHIFRETQSGTLTALLLAAHWLPGVLVAVLGGTIADQISPRRLLPITEMLSGSASLCLMPFIGSLAWPIFTIFFLRGMFALYSAALRGVVIKVCFDDAMRAQAGPALQASYYVGIGIAGVLGALLLEYIPLSTVIIIDVLTYCFSAFIFARITVHHDYENILQWRHLHLGTFRPSLKMLVSAPALIISFVLLVLCVAFYQGSFEIFMTILPPVLWNMQESGVSLMHGISGMGVLTGVYAYNNWLPRAAKKTRFSRWDVGLYALTCALYLGVLAQPPIVSMGMYYIFSMGFEVLWLRYFMMIIELCPAEHIGRISTLRQACAALVTAIMAMVTGWSFDHIAIGMTLLLLNAVLMLSG
jgi:predicted MFS family arabinose efflux permease